jgi:hypothetical protein
MTPDIFIADCRALTEATVIARRMPASLDIAAVTLARLARRTENAAIRRRAINVLADIEAGYFKRGLPA